MDEVNLLEDNIVDFLLDAVAMGVNYIEKEGISYSHSSSFMLIGMMSPEVRGGGEDLLSQLLDSFGLMVEVKGERNPVSYLGIIRRRMMYERDPGGFCRLYEVGNAELRNRTVETRDVVRDTVLNDRALDVAVRISLRLDVEGHRFGITIVRAACARAALDGRDGLTSADVVGICRTVLSHRMGRNPFSRPGSGLGGVGCMAPQPTVDVLTRYSSPPRSAATVLSRPSPAPCALRISARCLSAALPGPGIPPLSEGPLRSRGTESSWSRPSTPRRSRCSAPSTWTGLSPRGGGP